MYEKKNLQICIRTPKIYDFRTEVWLEWLRATPTHIPWLFDRQSGMIFGNFPDFFPRSRSTERTWKWFMTFSCPTTDPGSNPDQIFSVAGASMSCSSLNYLSARYFRRFKYSRWRFSAFSASRVCVFMVVDRFTCSVLIDPDFVLHSGCKFWLF